MDPVNNNVEATWDLFIYEFNKQFKDHTQTQQAHQQLNQLNFKFPDINQYILDFKDLVSMAGYTVENKETVNLFLKGFENAPDVLNLILSPPPHYHLL